GGAAGPLDQAADGMPLAARAVAATAGATPTVAAATVAAAMARRAGSGGAASGSPGTLVLLDLGVPRDVEPEVRALPGVVLADLDALRAVLETDEGPRQEVERVRALIAQETGAFMGG